MKLSLNLGSGDRYVEGWENADLPSTPHRKDVEVDLRGALPWEPGSVSRIYAGHLFEHLYPEDCERLCRELLRCADPAGCAMVVVGPDIQVAEAMIAMGTFDFTYHNLDTLKNGAGRWSGDVHLWETTGPSVAQLVHMAGWPVVHHFGIAQLEEGWPVADREPQWQYAIRAWVGPT